MGTTRRGPDGHGIRSRPGVHGRIEPSHAVLSLWQWLKHAADARPVLETCPCEPAAAPVRPGAVPSPAVPFRAPPDFGARPRLYGAPRLGDVPRDARPRPIPVLRIVYRVEVPLPVGSILDLVI
jgi:hypothetical protein